MLARITFTPVPNPPVVDFNYTGTYQTTTSLGVPIESGLFLAGGSPASAFIVLDPTGPAPARGFVVNGMFTDAAHKINYMLLSSGTSFFVPFRLI